MCPYFSLLLMITFISYIGEAISMAERIIVLTKRPAEIKKIFKINLTNAKTPIENRKCKEFPIYYQEIWKEIDHHV